MDKESNTRGGLGFCSVLCIIFIVLKLTNLIAWSWVWVLSPLWLPIAAIILIIIVMKIIFMLQKEEINMRENKPFNDIPSWFRFYNFVYSNRGG